MLIAPLHSGPVDIIGDVHGELEALETLLVQLGYDPDGAHPEGRRLVFLGDLVDRGEDSEGVVALVETLVRDHGALCILGNHELNLLRGQHDKEGNRWFSGRADEYRDEADSPQQPYHSVLLKDQTRRDDILRFFDCLPLVLERSDLRVVHAAWCDASVDALRACAGGVQETYKEHREAILNSEAFLAAVDDRDERSLLIQNNHPIKVLTSGLEARASRPFRANGKLRTLRRVAWWETYDAPQRVVFGHYWRELDGSKIRVDSNSLFKGISGHSWLGEAARAMCIDFRIGKQYRARNGAALEHPALLAALRLGAEGSLEEPQLIFHS